MRFSPDDTAVVVTDPQNDVLRPANPAWALLSGALHDNDTVANLQTLLEGAAGSGYGVFVSPHYNFDADLRWRFGGPIETMMHEEKMFSRSSALSLDGFRGSGADWLENLAPVIEDGKTVVTSPHKIFGPASNDLVLQLRKRGTTRVVLAGMLANLCVESHLRELLEAGFQVAVAADAVAAPRHPDFGDGNTAAQINYRFLTDTVLPTEQVVAALRAGAGA
ncbi:isochorismatase family protein [Kineococcus rhizosphaerae]|uniref:Nicotinamidase-related amidase n=1 Tax=Kineococcus rhizosphaerae TaxID=559628 RepID=A0A2T0R2V9_9ACTN|nr:isochorismatase family protein [Kineococcus rhizosphaerae]PRY14101.1 nicotinamidase-related amidase [Kineococcus rhizosphaerae]